MPLTRAVFDAHADSAVLPDLNGAENMLKLSDIYAFERYVQVFAVCTEYFDAEKYALEKIKSFKRRIGKEKIKLVLDKKDLENKYCAVLALEGADGFETLSAPAFFYETGVRLVTLVWNRENNIASNSFSVKDEGLKSFGKEIVHEIERLGMVLDLSHISDRAFYSVCEETKKPFVVSHSNSRRLFNHPRNITDDMFVKTAARGGCVGVNFEPDFLGGGKDVSEIIRHIEHFCAMDEKAVGIGSDFDGISRLPEGIRSAESIYRLGEALLGLNYSEKTVRGILFDNFFRVFKEIL